MYHLSGVEQMIEPSDEVTVTGGGIQVAISNRNDQGYCSKLILKVLVILCKHASKNSWVTFSISQNFYNLRFYHVIFINLVVNPSR